MISVLRRPGRVFIVRVAVLLAAFYLILTVWPLGFFGDALESVQLERFMNSGLASTQDIEAQKSSVDWSQIVLAHLPPATLTTLPQGAPKKLPQVQHSFPPEARAAAAVRRARRNEVRRVFKEDWQQYRTHAWMQDSFKPISGKGVSQFSGWAATLVDSLDSLWILGFREEFDEAVAAVAEIDFGQSTSNRINMFESTIRYLGGLLAAYDLSKREVLLAKAIELGNLLYAGFNTESQLPVDFMDFARAKAGKELQIESWVVSASPGSLSLEMTRLSQITGDQKYYDAVARVMRLFSEQQQTTKVPGLWPIWISMREQNLNTRSEFTLGGSADSLFEYLPKMHALLGGLEPMYETMTNNYIKAAEQHLFFRPMLPGEDDILISGNVNVDDDGNLKMDPESEHLTSFVGGNVALAGRLLGRADYVQTGAKLAKGCGYVYRAFPSGVMPERYNMVPCQPLQATKCPWNEELWIEEREKRPEWKSHLPKGFTTAKDPRYLLRPEAIESIFYLYRITGDSEYQDIAWDMFQGVINASATNYGHSSVRDVTKIFGEDEHEANLEDYMESFWFAETLKYYYLIFSPPDIISLDDYVLNTEAHPFRRPQ